MLNSQVIFFAIVVLGAILLFSAVKFGVISPDSWRIIVSVAGVIGAFATVVAIFLPPPGSTSEVIPDSDIVYDDFDNPNFDSKWNTNLWARAKTDNSDTDAIQQRNGILVVSTEDSFAALSSSPNKSWLMSELNHIEADLKLGGDFRGEYGHVQLALVSENTTANYNGTPADWFIVCQIESCNNPSWCAEAEQPIMTCFAPNGYNAPKVVEVDYDTWYTVRIKVDSETATFNFYFDNQFYDAFSPPNADSLKDDAFRVHVGSFAFPASAATGYIDEVRVVTK